MTRSPIKLDRKREQIALERPVRSKWENVRVIHNFVEEKNNKESLDITHLKICPSFFELIEGVNVGWVMSVFLTMRCFPILNDAIFCLRFFNF